jgi:hypothetical protein
MSTAAVLAGTNLIILPVARNIFSSVSSIANNDFDDNNHRLRTRKFPKKSHFDQESAAINWQPKTFAECTQVPLKRATLNTDGRGYVARSPDKGTTKRHRNTHQMSF